MVRHAISVRKPVLDFEQPIERFYLGDDPVKTYLFNALNLMFPDGERFFVKSVHRFSQRITDPVLQQDIRAFAGQEGLHAQHHERFFAVMKRQGYRVGGFLRYFNETCKDRLEKLPPSLALSITAGSEHYTAIMAAALLEFGLLDTCQPTMRDLITWHAIEEIEHKHVAFDVLQKLFPYNYPLRIAGFLVSTWSLTAHTVYAFNMLKQQDLDAGRVTSEQIATGSRQLLRGREGKFVRRVLVSALKYLKPGFHPSQKDDTGLLARYAPQIPEGRVAAA